MKLLQLLLLTLIGAIFAEAQVGGITQFPSIGPGSVVPADITLGAASYPCNPTSGSAAGINCVLPEISVLNKYGISPGNSAAANLTACDAMVTDLNANYSTGARLNWGPGTFNIGGNCTGPLTAANIKMIGAGPGLTTIHRTAIQVYAGNCSTETSGARCAIFFVQAVGFESHGITWSGTSSFGGATTVNGQLLRIGANNSIDISGFMFENSEAMNADHEAVYFTGPTSNNCIVTNSWVHDNGQLGLDGGCNHTIVTNNFLYKNVAGDQFSGPASASTGLPYDPNCSMQIQNNSFGPSDYNAAGISGTLVGLLVQDCSHTIISGNSFKGFVQKSGSGSLPIQLCFANSAFAEGPQTIDWQFGPGNTISGNTFDFSAGNGIVGFDVCGYSSTVSGNARIWGNTFWDNNRIANASIPMIVVGGNANDTVNLLVDQNTVIKGPVSPSETLVFLETDAGLNASNNVSLGWNGYTNVDTIASLAVALGGTTFPISSTTLATNASGNFIASGRQFGGTFVNGGSALVSGATTYLTAPFACTITAWDILVTPADTATIDIWKIATGTAIPTVSNSITASATPAISTGTAIHSTTLTGWSTGVNVAANDIIGINLKAVGGTATFANLTVQCQ